MSVDPRSAWRELEQQAVCRRYPANRAHRVGKLIGALRALALELLAPDCCAACGDPSRESFCERCGVPSPSPEESFEGVPLVALGAYASPLKQAVARFKFGHHPELARRLAPALAGKLHALALSNDDAIVPVPLHPTRLAERGYDQAALVARELARCLGVRFFPRLLERTRATAQQARLDPASRTDNVVKAFRLRQAFQSGRVVLFDDVVTTGATLRACFAVLREGGVEVLGAAALARAGTSRN